MSSRGLSISKPKSDTFKYWDSKLSLASAHKPKTKPKPDPMSVGRSLAQPMSTARCKI